MKIYHYSEKDFRLIGESSSDGSGMPGSATHIDPPKSKKNEIAVFIDGEWSIVDNYEGYIGYSYDGKKHEISEIGVKPKPSWTIDPPFVLYKAKQVKMWEINNKSQYPIIENLCILEKEAISWTSNKEAKTIMIDNIVKNRKNVTKSFIVDGILEDILVYKEKVGTNIGKKQHYISILEQALTQKDIDDIVVSYVVD